MTLDWTTVLFETINFVVLMLLLRRFLFRPARNALGERQRLLRDAQEEVEQARRDAENTISDYETKVRALAERARAERSEARAEGEREAAQILEAARTAAEEVRADASLRSAEVFADAFQSVSPKIRETVLKATRRLVREVGAGDVALAFARKGAREVREIVDRSGEHRHVEVHISPDVDLYAASGVLRDVLEGLDIELEVDESVVGGARFICGPTQVDSSAGACLDRWLERMAAVPEPARGGR